jgi:HSP20 family protein
MFDLEQTTRGVDPGGPAWRPEVDVFERPDGFLLCFSVPGVRQEDIQVVATDETVTVHGVRDLAAATDATPRRLELPRGHFKRSIRLPGTIASDEVRTQLTQGLLLVHVPTPRGYVRVRVEHKG